MDSLTIFIWGYSGTPQIWTLCQFSFRGSILGHLRFGFYDNFHFGGGVFWDTLDSDSLTIFILGGILEHLGFGLYDNFHFREVFWNALDLDSMTIFILGGILRHLGFGLSDNFHFGAYSGTPQIWTL